MIGLDSLRWMLTLAFGGATGFHLVRWLGRAAPSHEDAPHLVMGVAMIVMIWPWGAVVPESAWITVFTLAASWFLARAVDSRRLVPLFFATTMGAMVWMTASAPPAHAHLHHMRRDWVSAALGAYLVAASAWWVARGMRLSPADTGSPPPDWSALCHGTMSGGMGLALLAMA